MVAEAVKEEPRGVVRSGQEMYLIKMELPSWRNEGG
jgi:hypothetical protein